MKKGERALIRARAPGCMGLWCRSGLGVGVSPGKGYHPPPGSYSVNPNAKGRLVFWRFAVSGGFSFVHVFGAEKEKPCLGIPEIWHLDPFEGSTPLGQSG